MRRTSFFAAMVVALVSTALHGCGSPSDSHEGNSTSSAKVSYGKREHSEHSHDDPSHHEGAGQLDMDKAKAELARLPPEDAASAEKQNDCPVSGEILGTMGAPKKVEVNGQYVWICCESCEDKLLENPDEYLVKLRQE